MNCFSPAEISMRRPVGVSSGTVSADLEDLEEVRGTVEVRDCDFCGTLEVVFMVGYVPHILP